MSKKTKKEAPVVAILNMKGGVGKTTIAGNLFREMFKSKKINTLLIDLDAQF
ncbi:AAA family ATPase, partial [Desulfobacterales bacterium HSG2]|nr:AAA family ATPase [Desulfobacterales bacterium HSG2]